ncbi:MAG: hypothetical protein ACO1RX_10795 [Candidatus Sericytochromatia bacterium]
MKSFLISLLLLTVLSACSLPAASPVNAPTPQPTMTPPQGGTRALNLPAILPAGLEGRWIETQQPLAPIDGQSLTDFHESLIAHLEAQGALSLPKTGSEELPYQQFFNGRAPVLLIAIDGRSSWTDFRSRGTTALPDQPSLGLNASGHLVALNDPSRPVRYYVSKNQDQLLALPGADQPAGRVTIYIREEVAKARYGLCLDGQAGNAALCRLLEAQ